MLGMSWEVVLFKDVFRALRKGTVMKEEEMVDEFTRSEILNRCEKLQAADERIIAIDVSRVIALVLQANMVRELEVEVETRDRKIKELEARVKVDRSTLEKIWDELQAILNRNSSTPPTHFRPGVGELRSAFVEAVGWLERSKGVELLPGVTGADALNMVLQVMQGKQRGLPRSDA